MKGEAVDDSEHVNPLAQVKALFISPLMWSIPVARTLMSVVDSMSLSS